jgi:hypothetical protein
MCCCIKIGAEDLKKIQIELKAFLIGEGKKEVVSNSKERADLEMFA